MVAPQYKKLVESLAKMINSMPDEQRKVMVARLKELRDDIQKKRDLEKIKSGN